MASEPYRLVEQEWLGRLSKLMVELTKSLKSTSEAFFDKLLTKQLEAAIKAGHAAVDAKRHLLKPSNKRTILRPEPRGLAPPWKIRESLFIHSLSIPLVDVESDLLPQLRGLLGAFSRDAAQLLRDWVAHLFNNEEQVLQHPSFMRDQQVFVVSLQEGLENAFKALWRSNRARDSLELPKLHKAFSDNQARQIHAALLRLNDDAFMRTPCDQLLQRLKDDLKDMLKKINQANCTEFNRRLKLALKAMRGKVGGVYKQSTRSTRGLVSRCVLRLVETIASFPAPTQLRPADDEKARQQLMRVLRQAQANLGQWRLNTAVKLTELQQVCDETEGAACVTLSPSEPPGADPAPAPPSSDRLQHLLEELEPYLYVLRAKNYYLKLNLKMSNDLVLYAPASPRTVPVFYWLQRQTTNKPQWTEALHKATTLPTHLGMLDKAHRQLRTDLRNWGLDAKQLEPQQQGADSLLYAVATQMIERRPGAPSSDATRARDLHVVVSLLRQVIRAAVPSAFGNAQMQDAFLKTYGSTVEQYVAQLEAAEKAATDASQANEATATAHAAAASAAAASAPAPAGFWYGELELGLLALALRAPVYVWVPNRVVKLQQIQSEPLILEPNRGQRKGPGALHLALLFTHKFSSTAPRGRQPEYGTITLLAQTAQAPTQH